MRFMWFGFLILFLRIFYFEVVSEDIMKIFGVKLILIDWVIKESSEFEILFFVIFEW